MASLLPQTRHFLVRVRAAVRVNAVLTTRKADDEMLRMGWERTDLLVQLRDLQGFA